MKTVLKLLYNFLVLPLLWLYSKIMLLTNDKIRDRESKKDSYLDIPKKNGKRILIHASSMGEYEQAKYFVELIKKNEPETEIIASFFSPSGYNNLTNKNHFDYKVYSPIDFRTRAKKFVDHIDPDIVFIIRYDLWYNFLSQVKKNDTPLYLINATFTISPTMGKSMIGKAFYKMMISKLSGIYCVNEYHKNKFERLNLHIPVSILPDTRYDRILSKVQEAEKLELLDIGDNYTTLVVGSCWKQDIITITEVVKKLKQNHKLKVIYAPHEIDNKTISQITENVESCVLYSEMKDKNTGDNDIIINKIGLLLTLYKYADIAYVGGAFGAGVHSVTEPAGYGVPIICGNKHYKNSEDARQLVKSGGLITIGNNKELMTTLTTLLTDIDKSTELGNSNKKYIEKQCGSSEKLYDEVVR
ncbi:MAG: 3-deoxy-D-manno-octulosonic acid transferase [Chlorobiota bacterium]